MRVWAHRGARRQAPENTVAAFLRARALGADGVELDARRSADDVVVVHHDARAGGVGVLAEAPFAALRAARPEMPTLDEALDVCAGVLVNVEVKNLPGDPDYDPDERVTALVAETLARRDHRDDTLVSSFSLDTLDRFRRPRPDPDRAADPAGLRPARRAGAGRRPGPRRAAPRRAGPRRRAGPPRSPSGPTPTGCASTCGP